MERYKQINFLILKLKRGRKKIKTSDYNVFKIYILLMNLLDD